MVQEGYFQLIECGVKQAQAFLTKMHEFYPFGAILDSKNAVIPLGIYDEPNCPPSDVLIKGLEEYLKNQVDENKIFGACIVIDVKVNVNTENKSDAVLIRVDHKDMDNEDFYMPYSKDSDGKYHFYELIRSPGTLKLWNKLA